MNTAFDFEYYGFGLSRISLKEFKDEVSAEKRASNNQHDRQRSYLHGLVDHVIDSIATHSARFNPADAGLCQLLEELIVECGYDADGKYTPSARNAMKNLYAATGKKYDESVLQDKKQLSFFGKVKSTFKSMFGFGKSKEAKAEPKIEPKPEPKAEPKKTYNRTPKVVPGKKETPAQPEKKKKSYVTSIITRVVTTGIAAMAFYNVGTSLKNMATEPVKVPKTFKTIYTSKSDRDHYARMQSTYDLHANIERDATSSDSAMRLRTPVTNPKSVTTQAEKANKNPSEKYKSIQKLQENMRKYSISADSIMRLRMPTINLRPTFPMTQKAQHNTPKAQKVTKPQVKNKVATDSISVQLTRASKSALNILLGVRGAQKLCNQVQSQIDAGIFVAPNGMSVERIAHAMQMSRVYEGHSVILDALTSKTKLTPAQQDAFNSHIASIGDMGVKLQQRAAAHHKLSKHSKFNKAPKSLQKKHISNLKQLKQLKKAAHTR